MRNHDLNRNGLEELVTSNSCLFLPRFLPWFKHKRSFLILPLVCYLFDPFFVTQVSSCDAFMQTSRRRRGPPVIIELKKRKGGNEKTTDQA
jgi:hypothetical protein